MEFIRLASFLILGFPWDQGWFYLIDCEDKKVTHISTSSSIGYSSHWKGPGERHSGGKGYYVQGLEADPSLLKWVNVSETEDQNISKGHIEEGIFRGSEIYFVSTDDSVAIAIWKSGKQELLTYCRLR